MASARLANGASVVVIERYRAGWGASGRNGGFVLPGYKPDPAGLLRRCGLDRTRALLAATHEAIEGLEALIAREAVDCEYARRGWITLAAKPGHMRGLEQTARDLRRLLGHETTVLGAAELRQEIGSVRYHGGLLEPLAGAEEKADPIHRAHRASRGMIADAQIAHFQHMHVTVYDPIASGVDLPWGR